MKKFLSVILFKLFCSGVYAQSFTDNTPGTGKIFTIPANVTSVIVAIWGGGGGGGSAINDRGGGGGGGGASTKTFNVTAGNDITYTVGAAGAAGTTSSSSATSGGASFVTYSPASVSLSAAGGGRGINDGTGGAGGNAYGGTPNSNGGVGSGTTGAGGGSGTVLSIFGAGGVAVTSGNIGNPGAAPGAGGSGGNKVVFGTWKKGGAGAAGRFFVRYITVTSISPASVCPGQAITITGTNFSTAAGTTVTVAGVSCTNITVVNSTTITATVPEASAGGVVTINNANGINDGIAITIQTPSIAVNNTIQSQIITGVPTAFHTNCANLITVVNPSGASPVAGNVSASVWIETIQPTQFVKRHYEITPATNATTATGRVTLYFTQQEFDDFNAMNIVDLPTGAADATGQANLLIEKRGGTSGDGTGLPGSYTGTKEDINPADADIIWNSALSRWEVSFDVTGFSGFFVKTQAGVLPLTLTNFSGSRSNDVNNLYWQTHNEVNTKHFILERSDDVSSFTAMATIAANGSGANTYSYNDAVKQNGKLFYRLKMMDNDGRFTYSGIVALTGYANSNVTVSPNPVNNFTTVTVSNNLVNTKAILTDAAGKTIKQLTLTHTATSINLSAYPAGMYLLKLQNGQVVKLIKE